MVWTIPNILTFFRVLAAPCVALVFIVFDTPTQYWVALGIFVVASVTDFFDGWLARRLGQESEIGRMLDPIADKAMVMVALAVLMAVYGMSPFIVLPAALIMVREVLVSGLREYLGDVKLRVTRLAKWKTTVQMVAIGILLFAIALRWELANSSDFVAGQNSLEMVPREEDWAWRIKVWSEIVGGALLFLAAMLTVLSGWDYFRKGLVELRKREVKG